MFTVVLNYKLAGSLKICSNMAQAVNVSKEKLKSG
jgi:hypothetical protein